VVDAHSQVLDYKHAGFMLTDTVLKNMAKMNFDLALMTGRFRI